MVWLLHIRGVDLLIWFIIQLLYNDFFVSDNFFYPTNSQEGMIKMKMKMVGFLQQRRPTSPYLCLVCLRFPFIVNYLSFPFANPFCKPLFLVFFFLQKSVIWQENWLKFKKDESIVNINNYNEYKIQLINWYTHVWSIVEMPKTRDKQLG